MTKVLDTMRILGTSPSSTRGLALFTADPTETGSVTNEVSATEYERQAITFGAATTDGTDNTTASNDAQVEFPEATSLWGDITHGAIALSTTKATSDLEIKFGWDNAPITIDSNNVFRVDSSDLTIQLD